MHELAQRGLVVQFVCKQGFLMNNQHRKLLILNQYITHLEKPNFQIIFM